jgi:hypothetical protein
LGDEVSGIMRAYGQSEKRIERETGRDFGEYSSGKGVKEQGAWSEEQNRKKHKEFATENTESTEKKYMGKGEKMAIKPKFEEIRCPICNKKFGDWIKVVGRVIIGFFCRRCGKDIKIEKIA